MTGDSSISFEFACKCLTCRSIETIKVEQYSTYNSGKFCKLDHYQSYENLKFQNAEQTNMTFWPENDKRLASLLFIDTQDIRFCIKSCKSIVKASLALY